MGTFAAEPILRGLTDFQRATVTHVMDRFFGADGTRRFLTADETGLGKSFVARGVIAATIERLMSDPAIDRIDIVYVCSNADIAEQNVRRLNVVGSDHIPFASRLTLLALESHRLAGKGQRLPKPVNLISFTPGTSFDRGHRGGKAEERALLHILLTGGATAQVERQSCVLLRRSAGFGSFTSTIRDLEHRMSRHGHDHRIADAFVTAAYAQGLISTFFDMCDAVGERRLLTRGEDEAARELVGKLRHTLAKASVDALEPDLVILDEFQRFRHLLNPDSPQGELAHELFDYRDARVLLLSATPYKQFTFAEEKGGPDGDDHEGDFLDTVRFLAGRGPEVTAIQDDFARLRHAALTGADPTTAVTKLRKRLLSLMCRTERPRTEQLDMLLEQVLAADDVTAEDMIEFATLRALARSLDATFVLDYWKSVPYFLNFGDGYKLGSAVAKEVRGGTAPEDVRQLIASARTLDRGDVENGRPIEMGNARLRALAADTVERGWWRLLWMPPSLPYLEPAGPFAESQARAMTKRLVFSSWAATPTAVAALLSHEAQRHTVAATRASGGAPRSRLELRVDPGGRPQAMNAFAVFWPHPGLAAMTDPLEWARADPQALHSAERAEAALASRLRALLGPDGEARTSSAEAAYWMAAFRLPNATPASRTRETWSTLSTALAGDLDAEPGTEGHRGLAVHTHRAVAEPVEPPQERPADLSRVVAQIGLHGPGNIAWRSLGRVLDHAHTITPVGHWKAAAVIASGLRSLFNRPDAAALLDALYPQHDQVYWRAVLRYCAAGNLQSVLDEYVDHLAATRATQALDDDDLLRMAQDVRSAVALRPAIYTAFDPHHPDTSISFTTRFALRYGNRRQAGSDIDERQPAVRNAFNSPFWPFVLTTTSVGQEGIDLHWWCHSVMHWNTPPNPVDFDQREGRVDRWGGHAIRKNIAARHRARMVTKGTTNPWRAGFDAAAEERNGHSDLGELLPRWVYPGPAKITRLVAPYPLSVDGPRLQQLKSDAALYRLALGQPRQEDMLDILRARGVDATPEACERLRVDLRPPHQLFTPTREAGA